MAAKMATYGITITDLQLVLGIFANIDDTMDHDYDREFRPAMAAIHKLFKYNYVHTANSLKTIMAELGSADGVRTMEDAPSLSNLRGGNGTANVVDDSVSQI